MIVISEFQVLMIAIVATNIISLIIFLYTIFYLDYLRKMLKAIGGLVSK